jgi:hypothetical protein
VRSCIASVTSSSEWFVFLPSPSSRLLFISAKALCAYGAYLAAARLVADYTLNYTDGLVAITVCAQPQSTTLGWL